MLITFLNSFSSICESMDVDYGRVKEVVVQRNHIQDIYLNSSDDTKGFGVLFTERYIVFK